jgi:hypothetical protein
MLGPWLAPIVAHLHDDERAAVIALSGALESLSLSDRVSLCETLVAHFAHRHQLALPSHLSAERVLLSVRDALAGEAHTRASLRATGSQES